MDGGGGGVIVSTYSPSPTIDMSVSSSSCNLQTDKKQDSFKHQKSVSSGFVESVIGTPSSGVAAATAAAALAASSTTIEYKPKYNRRNNPDLEKRRIHFCDHLGKQDKLEDSSSSEQSSTHIMKTKTKTNQKPNQELELNMAHVEILVCHE